MPALDQAGRVTYYDYLLSEAARSRYVLAAHHVRDCPVIIEIGAFETPITDYLTRVPRAVYVLDPKTPPHVAHTLHGEPCRVEHVAKPFQDVGLDVEPGGYGLVMIGCSLKIKGETDQVERAWQRLYRLVEEARVTVLEYPPDWPRSVDNVEAILANARVGVDLSIGLDLSGNPGMAETAYARRRFMVLRPREAGS
jgi:hypothetical protein